MSERTRTIYYLTLCWKKDGEVCEDPPEGRNFYCREEAISSARLLCPQKGFWITVWEMTQTWDEEFGGWMAGPSKIVYKTRKMRGTK